MATGHCGKLEILQSVWSLPLLLISLYTAPIAAATADQDNGHWSILTASSSLPEARLVPGPDGRVTMVAARDRQPFGEPLTIEIASFWGTDGSKYVFRFIGEGLANEGTSINTLPGQPVTLDTTGIPDGEIVRGTLRFVSTRDPAAPLTGDACEDDAATRQPPCARVLASVPVAIGNFGPFIGNPPLEVSASGTDNLSLDLSQHRLFGNEITLELADFSFAGRNLPVYFVTGDGAKPTSTLQLSLTGNRDRLDLPIDATSLPFGQSISGYLQTRIGDHAFIATPVVLERKPWTTGATLREIRAVTGKGPHKLILNPAADQPIFGLMVSSDTEATEAFDPFKHLRVELRKGKEKISLWTPTSNSDERLDARTLQPNGSYEVLVGLNNEDELSPGTYESVLRFGALNIAPDKWVDARVTFVKKNPEICAILTLIAAVLLSFFFSKGAVAYLRRYDLKSRINQIRATSWLRSDRWGALPVVRAFSRVAQANSALSQNRNALNFLKLVTTPDLAAKEVSEVEARLKVLKRINQLAIYWKAAPTASGLQADGVAEEVVRRAQKVLNRIVNRMSQLQNGEPIGPEITGEIEALEAWTQRERMEAGYWASLKNDMELLLDRVQLNEFAFDVNAMGELSAMLTDSAAKTTKAEIKQAIENALIACRAAESDGTQPIRNALPEDATVLPNDTQILALIAKLQQCEREVVRRLHDEIDGIESPGSLNKMIDLERTYGMLKLIWEQRDVSGRRKKFVQFARDNAPVKEAFKWLDDEVWNQLKKPGAVSIAKPGGGRAVEVFEPVDFKAVCNTPESRTYLFKHGLEYEWKISIGDPAIRVLSPVSRSTTVTQFIPEVQEVTVELTMIYKRTGESHKVVPSLKFTPEPTTCFENLSAFQVTEWFGVFVALILAFVAGLESDAYEAALSGSWKEYGQLVLWGVGAEQTRNFLQNFDKFVKSKDAPAS